MSDFPGIFSDASTVAQARLEPVFQIRLWFSRVQNIVNMPSGAGRGAVYVDRGTIEGPRLSGAVEPGSGGDWALFRPDGVLAIDARYMLRASDGTLILMHNRGYLWGRRADVMPRIRAWIFEGGPPVAHAEYYLRAFPTFEVETGPHDWLMRYVIVGVGERKGDGNLIRYYALL
ncbi:MAG TPA: DUF3237 domain-containing protein [Steroidobacteraceae bacterium]|nr:DUF3237 domain-containing protein [Steroidobacteraceae bacterium]